MTYGCEEVGPARKVDEQDRRSCAIEVFERGRLVRWLW